MKRFFRIVPAFPCAAHLCAVLLSTVLLSTTLLSGCGFRASGKTPPANSSEKQLTQTQKLADFEYMYDILRDNYPYFGVAKREDGIDWLANYSAYRKDIQETKDDEEFGAMLNSILQDLHNGHVSMFKSGDGSPESYTYYRSLYNAVQGRAPWKNVMNNPKAEARYGVTGNSSGSPQSDAQESSDQISPNNVSTRMLKNNTVAYLCMNTFNHFNVEPDQKVIRPFLQSIGGAKALILDIRSNGGGDDAYWMNLVANLIRRPVTFTERVVFRGGAFEKPFLQSSLADNGVSFSPISALKNVPKLPPEVKNDFTSWCSLTSQISPDKPVAFHGKIYLLVSGNVFSSSEAFAVFCKTTGFATIVGTRTGGDGIGSDPALCMLPNSGYIFRFPMEMGLNPDGSSNFEAGTEPDISVPADSGSLDLESQPAVQDVLSHVS